MEVNLKSNYFHQILVFREITGLKERLLTLKLRFVN